MYLSCIRSDLRLGARTDQQVIDHVSDIIAALIGCGKVAIERGDKAWLDRRRWFRDACARLFNGEPTMMLDG